MPTNQEFSQLNRVKIYTRYTEQIITQTLFHFQIPNTNAHSFNQTSTLISVYFLPKNVYLPSKTSNFVISGTSFKELNNRLPTELQPGCFNFLLNNHNFFKLTLNELAGRFNQHFLFKLDFHFQESLKLAETKSEFTLQKLTKNL